MKSVVKEKIADLKKVDSERGLYSLNKSVKDAAVYPKPFGGKESDDVFHFKEKMIEALSTNQIREKDKIEVLRKHLTGKAKEYIGPHYGSIDKAFVALLEHFGFATSNWKSKLNKFIEKNKNPKLWQLVTQ